MRIGLLYPERRPLDPQSWSGTPAGLASGFAELGCEVVPIGTGTSRVLHKVAAGVARLSGHTGAVYDRTMPRQFARNRGLAQSMKQAGTLDIVVSMGSELYDLALLRKSLAPVAPVVTYDDGTLFQMWNHPDSDLRLSGYPDSRVQTWVHRQRLSSRAADLNLVSTSWASRSFIDDYGIDPLRVKTVGMGHNPRKVDVTARDWSIPRYLYLGVDWQRKNGAAVLAAFKRVRRDYPEARLDMVGNTPAVHEPGVTIHGLLRRGDPVAQKNIDGLFSRATCFTMPSRLDPSPIAYLEAGSAGLPVVGTREGGAAELLGEGAIAVNPLDTEAITSAMLELANPDRARVLGGVARRAAASTTWSGVAQKMLEATSVLRAEARTRSGIQVRR